MQEPNREKEIFEQALDIESPEERAAFIHQACAGDEALIARIKSLLKASETALEFLPEAPQHPPDAGLGGLAVERPGTVIGRYKLLEQIGEGGFGYVYMAEQLEPVKRRVALKIIKPGMDSKQVIGRFEAERQALALMDHPNIAQIYDAGTTEGPLTRPSDTLSPGGGEGQGEGEAQRTPAPTHYGRPYFVMELVKGIPITKFCEERQLDLESRLKLFIRVCSAVQHAHQKGIIHRDLKPSNILVTLHGEEPVPKVIDFGIAKATQQPLTDKTVFTQFQQFLGTPAYMSPEQATLSGLDVDTRSDIYSLGVLLYELLTGSPPFDTKQLLSAGLDEMRRIIQEKAPDRPSTRIRKTPGGTRAPARPKPAPSPVGPEGKTCTDEDVRRQVFGGGAERGTRGRVRSSIPSDLDWIVMKCLEKDRTRRYETANGLAEDLRRHLHNEPILARPPSRLYEFQKSVRRHKVGFAATTVVILLLAAGVLVSSWQARRARQAESQAHRRAYVADMRTLGESLDHNLARARRLLNDYQPRPGEEDLRDFEWYYFNHVLSENESTVLGTHPGGAMTLLTRPDGTFITAGSVTNWALAAGNLEIWDGLEAKLKSSLVLPQVASNGAIAIALSHDGKRLAIARRDLDIEIRSVDQPDQVQTVLTNWHRGLRHNAWTMAMCFVDDDTQLAVGDWSINYSQASLPLTFVQIASDQTNHTLPFVPPLGLNGLAVSRNGRRLAVKDSSGRIIILDFPGPKPVCSIETRDTWWFGAYPAMTFLNDPDRLVTTSDSGRIVVWDIPSTNRAYTIGNHGGFVTALALSPDGRRLASASLDQKIKVWDPHQAKQPPLRVLRGHTDRIFGVGFLPDGHTLVSCGADQAVRRWDLRRPSPDQGRWPLPPEVRYATIRFGVLGAIAAEKGKEGWKLWDVSHLSQSTEPRPISSPASLPAAVVLPLPGTDYYLVWPRPSTTQLAPMFLAHGLNPLEPVAGFPKISAGTDLRFNHPLLMVHGAINGEPYDLVWDITRSRKVHLVKSLDMDRASVAFASDGSFVILGTGGRLEKLDLTTGISDAWNEAAPPVLSTLVILPDNQTVIAGGALGVLRKLNFSTRQKEDVIGSPMQIQCMCLSPSGTRLATGDATGSIKLWDVETLREVALLGTHPGRVMGLYFTPDGRNLLSVDATELRVWRTTDH